MYELNNGTAMVEHSWWYDKEGMHDDSVVDTESKMFHECGRRGLERFD